MSVLTGAELGGGLPPPGSATPVPKTERGEESPPSAVSFSSEAAILQLTNTAARTVVQRGQELVDRRNEKNAAEKEAAREAAAKEARDRSLEEQGLKEPEPEDGQALVSTVKGDEVPVGEASESAATPFDASAIVTSDAPPKGDQEAEFVDESGHLDVVA